MVDLAPKAPQKLLSKSGDCNQLYVTKLKAIDSWFFHKEFTGRKSTIVKKVSDMIEDNHEGLEATNEAALSQHIKDNNLEINMEVAMAVR